MIRIRTALAGSLLALTLTCASGCASTGSATPAAAASTLKPAVRKIVLPTHPRVYFYGDSWTAGATAEPGRGFPQVVGDALGWRVTLGPNESGAGYVHTYDPSHPVFPEAVAALKPFKADLIVLEGGLNDIPGPLDHFWNTARKTIKTLRAKAGGAPIVLVGPASPDGVTPEGLSAIDYELNGVAQQLGIHYVSPIQRRWFNPRNVRTLVDPKTFHPNTAGHAYYGGRLADALAAITRQR